MSGISRKSKMFQFLNSRIRVRIQDNRVLVGKFMAFDRHMNMVLADVEEYRTIVSKGSKEEREEKRGLGLVLLRGEHVISITVEGNLQARNTERFAPPAAAVPVAAPLATAAAVPMARGGPMPPMANLPAQLR